MGSPSGRRRRRHIMIMAGVIVLNRISCTVPADTLTEPRGVRFDELAIFGQWNVIDIPAQSRINAIHAALLPTGKVLIIAGSGNSPRNFDAGRFSTLLWDPQTGQSRLIPTPDDMFCGGHRFVSPRGIAFAATEQATVGVDSRAEVWVESVEQGDGSVITEFTKYRVDGVSSTISGTAESLTLDRQPAHGASFSYEFDPQTERYQRVADMHHVRWYPTLVGLADGNAITVSGLDELERPLDGHQLYRSQLKQWFEQPALNRYFPTPALFLMTDGWLFYSGSTAGYGRSDGAGRLPGIWNLSDDSFTPLKGLRDPELTETSASVLLPPAQDQRVMVLGDGGIDDSAESTARTGIVDLRSPHPHFMPGPDLAQPTRYLSAVILPDDTVLTTGGSRAFEQRVEVYSPPYLYGVPDRCSPRAQPCSSAAAPPLSALPTRTPSRPPN